MIFLAATLLIAAGGVWLVDRLFWSAGYGVSFVGGGTERVWSYYYRELSTSGALAAETAPDDGRFDVLLLGASVLDQVAPELRRRLDRQLDGRARVFSLARAAHTSRDSLLKFRRLGQRHFDLIVIYHGINDARMNCCEPGAFESDYGHCGWYASFERRLTAGRLNLLDVAVDRADDGRITLGEPPARLRRFGRDIKTPPVFRSNVAKIVGAAGDRDIPVVLMTFACHIPDDYSEEAFAAGRLGYGPGKHRLRAEVWGEPGAVRQTVTAHNRELRALAAEYDNVVFIDQESRLPRDGRHFSDPCHLTSRGIETFVDNLLPAVLERAAQIH